MTNDKFFINDSGELIRNDSSCELVRKTFKMHYREIWNARQLLACLREGQSTSLGGYQCWFYTADGGVLSFESVLENLPSVLWSIRHKVSDGWQVVGLEAACNIDYDIVCDHSLVTIVEGWSE